MIPEITPAIQVRICNQGDVSASSSAMQQIGEVLERLTAETPVGELEQAPTEIARLLAASNASTPQWEAAFRQVSTARRCWGLATLTKAGWKSIRKAAIAEYAMNNPQRAEPLVTAQAMLDGAPVPPDAVVPRGYQVVEGGVFRADNPPKRIAPSPVVINGRFVDDADGTESLKLAWRRDGIWRQELIPRAKIAAQREIVALAAIGFPVTSTSASDMVAYLAEFEAANIDLLPKTQVQHQFGWTKDETAFILGQEVICVTDTPPDVSQCVFHGADAGDVQAAKGYKAGGTIEGWKQVVSPVLAFSAPRLVLQASFASPLLKILGTHNFSIDMCGETSKGKTTMLRVAASVWGCPDEKDKETIVATWSATRIGSERRLGHANGVPTFRDDTRLATNREEVGRIIYDVAEGQTRDRGTVTGLDLKTFFSTILFSTGEAPLVGFSDGGGARGRIISLWGAPFGPGDRRELILGLNAGVLTHYGHAGRIFVRYLLDHRDQWDQWRQEHQRLRAAYADLSGGNTVLVRQADAFAAITLAGRLAAVVFDNTEFGVDSVAELWDRLAGEASEADRAALALQEAYNWAASHSQLFYGDPSARQTQDGWAGVWSGQGCELSPAAWDFIGFMPNTLKEIFAKRYEADAVIKTWKDRGWLLVDPTDRSGKSKQLRMGSKTPRLIVVKQEAFASVGAIPDREVNASSACAWLVEQALTMESQVRRLASNELAAGIRDQAVEALRVFVNCVRSGVGSRVSLSGPPGLPTPALAEPMQQGSPAAVSSPEAEGLVANTMVAEASMPMSSIAADASATPAMANLSAETTASRSGGVGMGNGSGMPVGIGCPF